MKQKTSVQNFEKNDIFSNDPNERKIEEAFLLRLLESTRQNSKELLHGQRDDMESAVTRQLQLFESPVFRKLSEALEKSIPEDTGFTKFPHK